MSILSALSTLSTSTALAETFRTPVPSAELEKAVTGPLVLYADVWIWFAMLALALLYPALRHMVFSCQSRSQTPLPPLVTNTHTSRSVPIDAVRAISIIAVMGIHALYFPASIPGLSLPDWVSSTLLNNLLRFAVPVFLMFSGYCLTPWSDLPTSASRLDFFAKKIKRIFLPYLIVASCLYLMGNSWDWKKMFVAVLCGSVSPPFYFIVVLAQLYLIYPILCRLSTRPTLLLSGSLVVSSVSSLYPPLREISGFPLFAPYLFPFVFGMTSSTLRDIVTGRACNFALPATVASLTYIGLNVLLSMLAISANHSNYAIGLYSYNFQFFYAIAVLFLLLHLLVRFPRLACTLASLGKYSLWVFLLHYPIQQWLWQLVHPQSSTPALVASILVWVGLSLVCSLLAQWVNCRMSAFLRS